MNFIDYCIYTKNFAAITAVKEFINTPKETLEDVGNLLRKDENLEKEELKRKKRLKDNLNIAASIATLGYIGTRMANYINKKYFNNNPDVDSELLDIQDE